MLPAEQQVVGYSLDTASSASISRSLGTPSATGVRAPSSRASAPFVETRILGAAAASTTLVIPWCASSRARSAARSVGRGPQATRGPAPPLRSSAPVGSPMRRADDGPMADWRLARDSGQVQTSCSPRPRGRRARMNAGRLGLEHRATVASVRHSGNASADHPRPTTRDRVRVGPSGLARGPRRRPDRPIDRIEPSPPLMNSTFASLNRKPPRPERRGGMVCGGGAVDLAVASSPRIWLPEWRLPPCCEGVRKYTLALGVRIRTVAIEVAPTMSTTIRVAATIRQHELVVRRAASSFRAGRSSARRLGFGAGILAR